MATKMHRLQISLPPWQAQFLSQRARRDGASMAEVVRRLVQREAEAARAAGSTDGLWEIAGIAEDRGALVDGVAVSENPELYLAFGPRRSRRTRRS